MHTPRTWPEGKVFRIGTVRMSAHASQAFIIAHCIDSADLPPEALTYNKKLLSKIYHQL